MHDVIDFTDHTFVFSIVLGSTRVRETECDSMLVKKLVEFFVVKFTIMVTLERINFSIELVFYKSYKVKELGEDIRFITNKVNPNKVVGVI